MHSHLVASAIPHLISTPSCCCPQDFLWLMAPLRAELCTLKFIWGSGKPSISQNVIIFGDRVSKRLLSENEITGVGSNPVWSVPFSEEERRMQTRTQGWLCDSTGRGWPSTSPGERPQTKRPSSPWSWASSLQSCKKLSFCCLSQSAYDSLLWQPKQINVIPYNTWGGRKNKTQKISISSGIIISLAPPIQLTNK